MFGDIIVRLTDPVSAEAALEAVASRSIRARVDALCQAEGEPAGELVARKVQHVIEHGGEEMWLDLMGVMANSPQPGAAAIDRMLAHAFPDPARVRITHTKDASP